MNVKIFKLTTGDEIIAEIDENFKSTTNRGVGFIIKNPLTIHMMRTPEGPTMGFVQTLFAVKPGQPMELPLTAITLGPLVPAEEVEQSYLQNVTGLILPPAKSSQILHG